MKIDWNKTFNLKTDQASNEEILDRINSGATVTGANMYILIFAILIASIGLNMNSTAVVIGAMLISPLMGVLMSIAYGIAAQDIAAVRKSVVKFLFQVVISITTSTVYFVLSPLDSFSGELAARTHPTLWDALIAFCGGFAAVIASTRKDKVSNVIPGTAIATALMPPLCTVGYCIASAKWISALGAFYLFLINVIFICLSIIIGLAIMKVTEKHVLIKKRTDRIILALIIAIAIVPSGILAWQSVKENYTDKQYRNFLEEEFQFENTQIMKSSISDKDKKIEVILIGSPVREATINEIKKSLPEYGLDKYSVDVVQMPTTFGISKDEIKELLEGKTGIGNISDLEVELDQTNKLLQMHNESKALQSDTSQEIMILYPQVKAAGFSDLFGEDGKTYFSLILTVETELDKEEKDTLQKWLATKFEEPVKIVQMVEDN